MTKCRRERETRKIPIKFSLCHLKERFLLALLRFISSARMLCVKWNQRSMIYCHIIIFMVFFSCHMRYVLVKSDLRSRAKSTKKLILKKCHHTNAVYCPRECIFFSKHKSTNIFIVLFTTKLRKNRHFLTFASPLQKSASTDFISQLNLISGYKLDIFEVAGGSSLSNTKHAWNARDMK